MFPKQKRLSGIAPTSMAEAIEFAERYLEPEQEGSFVEYMLHGGTLCEWLQGADEETRSEITTDSLCITSDIARLPYTERLDALSKERMRFDAWRAQREAEMDHVC